MKLGLATAVGVEDGFSVLMGERRWLSRSAKDQDVWFAARLPSLETTPLGSREGEVLVAKAVVSGAKGSQGDGRWTVDDSDVG